MDHKIRILFEPQMFNRQKYGGITRYFFELLMNLHNDEEIDFILPLIFSSNHYLKKAPFIKCPNLIKPIKIEDENPFSKFLSKPIWKISKRIYKFQQYLNRIKLHKTIETKNFDICHPTYYSTEILRYVKNKPVVITVHDMIYELFPEYFPDDPFPAYKKDLIKIAHKIIANSENTKRDLIKIHNVPADKIEVIYLGCSFNKRDLDIKKNMHLPEEYILFVGERKNYKNFIFFMNSIAPLTKKHKNMEVICTGNKDFSDSERALIDSLNLSKRVSHYSVSDDLLIELYKKATVFVFPSLYEGFGIPILEAFSAGCPVACSNKGSLPEVAGDAAVFFDPKDEDSICYAVDQLISDKAFRNGLINKGYERLRNFSWKETAHRTKKLYMSLM
jgi:glycosyltransferase involved in cell wall biosynthesis